MAVLQFRKVSVLPSSPEPNTLYLLNVGSSVQLFVTGTEDPTFFPVVSAVPPVDDGFDEFFLLGMLNDKDL